MANFVALWNCRRLPTTRETATSWAFEQGLLPCTKSCDRHRLAMRIKPQHGYGAFYCNAGGGKCSTPSVAKDTWFEGSRLKPQDEIRLMYGFAHDESYDRVTHECMDFDSSPEEQTALGRDTIAARYMYCRQLVADHFSLEQHERGKIRATGIVQIDESKFGKRKFNTGRMIEGHWVLGISCEQTSEFGMVICPENSQTTKTLVPIIKEHVAAGSTIWTEGWCAYLSLPCHGNVHAAVNHSVNFVDPETGVNTQRAEALWRAPKGYFHGKHVPEEAFAEHLCEYLWRRWNKKNKRDPFEALLQAIRWEFGDFRA